MLSNQINPRLGTYSPNPHKTISIPLFQHHLLRYFIALTTLALLLLVSTSYVDNTASTKENGMEYFAPACVDSLRDILSDSIITSDLAVSGERIIVLESVKQFYRLNDFRPVWTHTRGLTRRASALVELIAQARYYGLEPLHYHYSAIRELQHTLSLKDMDHADALKTDLEILMTDAALSFMINLRAGYMAHDSALASENWLPDLPATLLQGIMQGQLQQEILSMQPGFKEYQRLQKATAKFVQHSHITDQWGEICYPSNDSVALRHQVRKALLALGYLDKDQQDDMVDALKVFQHYHGLTADGNPGANTIEALRQSTLDRYRKLALNLDRLRKQSTSDTTMLYVNIPSYQLKIYRHNTLIDTFRVIVGHPSSPTPLFNGNMETIIVNPVWYVPRSIAMSEILPKIKSDTGYLRRNGFKILDGNYRAVNESSLDLEGMSADNFNYTLRQSRGSDNALGHVKFIISNPYAVYIHDTPGRTLFNKDIRAYSHGCIRLKDPERLASYIVREINAEEADLAQMIENGRHYEINIAASLPVYIRYITCEADDDGNVFYYKDIYGLDEREMQAFIPLMGI